MAYVMWMEVRYGWVPDGAFSAALGQNQANVPGERSGAGTATAPIPMSVSMAQSAYDLVGKPVPGGDTPTGANFQTALNNCAADLYTNLTTTNAVPGFTSGTLLAKIQAWATGGG